MRKKSLSEQQCPIARSLDRVGEWWSLLIIRDALHGLSRFDDFQKSLGISPNILTRRLTALIEGGLMEKQLYSDRPPRYQYVLTPCGQDLSTVLIALLSWGNNHLTPEGISIQLMDTQTGELVEPLLVDKLTGQEISPSRHILVAGPAASDGMKQRICYANGVMDSEKRSKQESTS